MPTTRARKRRPYYSVIVIRYATAEDRSKPSHGETSAFHADIVHDSTSEAQALGAFGRACIAQSGDLLAFYVSLERDGETIAQVQPVPPL